MLKPNFLMQALCSSIKGPQFSSPFSMMLENFKKYCLKIMRKNQLKEKTKALQWQLNLNVWLFCLQECPKNLCLGFRQHLCIIMKYNDAQENYIDLTFMTLTLTTDIQWQLFGLEWFVSSHKTHGLARDLS